MFLNFIFYTLRLKPSYEFAHSSIKFKSSKQGIFSHSCCEIVTFLKERLRVWLLNQHLSWYLSWYLKVWKDNFLNTKIVTQRWEKLDNLCYLSGLQNGWQWNNLECDFIKEKQIWQSKDEQSETTFPQYFWRHLYVNSSILKATMRPTTMLEKIRQKSGHQS